MIEMTKPLAFEDDTERSIHIYECVVPRLLKVIEDSGLSYQDAKKVPDALKVAIDFVCEGALSANRFCEKNGR